jgi:hypothetical protein
MSNVVEILITAAVVALLLWLGMRDAEARERELHRAESAPILDRFGIAVGTAANARLTLVSPGTYRIVAAQIIKDELGLSTRDAFHMTADKNSVVFAGQASKAISLARALDEQGAVVELEAIH